MLDDNTFIEALFAQIKEISNTANRGAIGILFLFGANYFLGGALSEQLAEVCENEQKPMD